MARKQEPRSHRDEVPRGMREPLEDRSIDELRGIARDLGIPERDSLDREQLIDRIEDERTSLRDERDLGGEQRAR